MTRSSLLALTAIAAGGLALRLVALFAAGGPLAAPTGYDDGVYFSASALFVRGVLPYRDFVFVHPPGIVLALASVSWWPDPAQAFAAARVLACLVGAVNIFLAGRIAGRAAGPLAGVVAAFLYATYPDAVIAERSPYLEPFLNLAALASAWLWLRERGAAAGFLAGAACAVKFWGGIWVLAALLCGGGPRLSSDDGRGGRRSTFLGGAVLAGIVLAGLFFLFAPRAFLTQTLLFQFSRPVDGIVEKGLRLREIAGGGHLVASVLALIAILFTLKTRDGRYFTIAMLLTVAGFVASSSYWNHYNSHLAASQCVLAGLGAAAIARVIRIPAVVAVLVVALQIPSLRHVWRASHDRAHDVPAAGRAIRAAVPAGESVFAFDPTWTLAAGRLPPHGDGAPVVVDSYGAMLLEAVRSGKRFRDTGAAFQSGVAQPAVRARLEKSPYAIVGWRGNWQLGFEDRLWFASNFLCVTPEAGEQCVWGRTREPIGPALAYAGDAKVDFGEGWYDEEGFPAWRWMAGRSVTTLPAIATPARLQLYFHAPHESNVTIESSGRVLDRFRAAPGEFFRSYDIAPGGAQTLVITTDRTLNPARDGQSTDTRDLGLSLKRLIWLPLAEWPARGGAASTSSRR